MSNYMRRYVDGLPTIEECVVRNGDAILFTPVGIARFKERFARGGFDIARIDDWLTFCEAIRLTVDIELACFAEIRAERRAERKSADDPDPLERDMIEAHFAGNDAEVERLRKKLLHQRRAQLKAVPAAARGSR